MSGQDASEPPLFLVACNPQGNSRLPYLLRLPLERGLVLKARAPWPAPARVSCHPFEEPWPADADVVEQTPVRLCRRRGAATDRLQARYREIQLVFADSRRYAEDWTYRFLARALTGGTDTSRTR